MTDIGANKTFFSELLLHLSLLINPIPWLADKDFTTVQLTGSKFQAAFQPSEPRSLQLQSLANLSGDNRHLATLLREEMFRQTVANIFTNLTSLLQHEQLMGILFFNGSDVIPLPSVHFKTRTITLLFRCPVEASYPCQSLIRLLHWNVVIVY